MDALKIEKATVAGCDWGARTACILAALWPERVKALVSVSGYEHRVVTGGIGHNLPQEAPEAFAAAVTDLARL